MNILLCCQSYAPSVGGVPEVIRQIAEGLATRGHQLTVATGWLPSRDFDILNGVVIKEFNVKGNQLCGMTGETAEYQSLVVDGGFDLIMVYAAQQWTFDALWPVLDKIKSSKVLVPCGFSSLYEPGYRKYFQALPEVLKKFDHLIFHALQYRDIDFARKQGLDSFSVIANGASEIDFDAPIDPLFRIRHGIAESSFLFLTVGSFTGQKGHDELVNAFAAMELPMHRHATLMLNGNALEWMEKGLGSALTKLLGLVKMHGLFYALKRAIKKMAAASRSPRDVGESVNQSQANKRVLVTNLPRKELTQAFMAADLFVFASNIEYSPLVLFEAAAAGTPFLSVNVGNATEIAQWTGAGIICPSSIDAKGYTKVDEKVLAKTMAALMEQKERLKSLGAIGKRNWQDHYKWENIVRQYEHTFEQLVLKNQASRI